MMQGSDHHGMLDKSVPDWHYTTESDNKQSNAANFVTSVQNHPFS